MTTITYVLATENGQYNPTVPYGAIDIALNVIGRYKNVKFTRINDWNRAVLKVVNARSLNAWATFTRSSRTIRIHPTVNYGRNKTTFTKVLQHELGHWVMNGHHNDVRGLMHPTSGNVFNWGSMDQPWINHWAWKGALRPWSEPNYFKDVFNVPKIAEALGSADNHTLDTEDADVTFGCPSWFKELFSREPKIQSVQEVSASDLKLFDELCVACHTV
jgi:hypothetical protein